MFDHLVHEAAPKSGTAKNEIGHGDRPLSRLSVVSGKDMYCVIALGIGLPDL